MNTQTEKENQQQQQTNEIPLDFYRFPTTVQLETFFMLRQTKESQYEISRENIGNIAMSNVAKHQEIQLSNDQMQVKGSQGYRTSLGTHGVAKGTFYYECYYESPQDELLKETISKHQQAPQVRIGFQMLDHPLNGPVGFDKTGIAIRSIDCSICTARKRLFNDKDNFTESYQSFQIKEGQIIGCLIHIPESYQPTTILPEETELCMEKVERKKDVKQNAQYEFIQIGQQPVDYDSPSVLTIMKDIRKIDLQPNKNQPEQIVPDSFIEFYVDGELVAKKYNILYGRWYPAISCYNYAHVTVNFGARNIRIPGYPFDFYCLKGCLLNPLTDDINKYLRENYGYQKLNIQKIVELDDKQPKVMLDMNIQDLNSSKNSTTQQLNQPQQALPQLNSISLGSENETSPISINIQNKDLEAQIKKALKQNCLFFNKTEYSMKQQIRALYNQIKNGDNLKFDSAEIQQQIDGIKNKGFKYLPRQNANPFTILYIPRAEVDYKLTNEYIQKGIYNKFIHEWISRMYDEKHKKIKK